MADIEPDSGHPTPRDAFGDDDEFASTSSGAGSPVLTSTPMSVPRPASRSRRSDRSIRSIAEHFRQAESSLSHADTRTLDENERDDVGVIDAVTATVRLGRMNHQLMREKQQQLNESRLLEGEKDRLERMLSDRELELQNKDDALEKQQRRISELEHQLETATQMQLEMSVRLNRDTTDASTQESSLVDELAASERARAEQEKRAVEEVRQLQARLASETTTRTELLTEREQLVGEVERMKQQVTGMENKLARAADAERQLKGELDGERERNRKHDLKEHEIHRLARDLDKMKNNHTVLEEKLHLVREEKKWAQEAVKEAQEKAEVDAMEKEQLSSDLRDARSEVSTLAESVTRLSGELAAAEGRRVAIEQEKDRLEEAVSEWKREAEQRPREKEAVIGELNGLVAGLKGELEEMRNRAERSERDGKDTRSMLDLELAQSERERNEAARWKSEAESARLDADAAVARCREMEEKVQEADVVRKRLEQAHVQIADLRRAADEAANNADKYRTEAEFLRKSASEVPADWQAREQELREKVAAVEMLLDRQSPVSDERVLSLERELAAAKERVRHAEEEHKGDREKMTRELQHREEFRAELDEYRVHLERVQTEYEQFKSDAEAQYCVESARWAAELEAERARNTAMHDRLMQLEKYPGQLLSMESVGSCRGGAAMGGVSMLNRSLYDMLPSKLKELLEQIGQQTAEIRADVEFMKEVYPQMGLTDEQVRSIDGKAAPTFAPASHSSMEMARNAQHDGTYSIRPTSGTGSLADSQAESGAGVGGGAGEGGERIKAAERALRECNAPGVSSNIRDLVVGLLLRLQAGGEECEAAVVRFVADVQSLLQQSRTVWEKRVEEAAEKRLSEEHRRFDAEIREWEEQLEQAKQSEREQERVVEQLRSNVDDLRVAEVEAKRQVYTLEKRAVEAEHALAGKHALCEEYKAGLERAVRELEGSEQELVRMEKQYAEATARLVSLSAQADEEKDGLRRRLETANATVEELRRRTIETETEMSRLRGDLERIESETERERLRVRQLKEEVSKREKAEMKAVKRKEYNQETMTIVMDNYDRLNAHIAFLKKRNGERQKLIDQVKKFIAQHRRGGSVEALDGIASRIEERSAVWMREEEQLERDLERSERDRRSREESEGEKENTESYRPRVRRPSGSGRMSDRLPPSIASIASSGWRCD